MPGGDYQSSLLETKTSSRKSDIFWDPSIFWSNPNPSIVREHIHFFLYALIITDRRVRRVLLPLVPEVQGSTQEVASSKCKKAAELVWDYS